MHRIRGSADKATSRNDHIRPNGAVVNYQGWSDAQPLVRQQGPIRLQHAATTVAVT